MKQENNPGISFFQRYLTLWVAICMVLGVSNVSVPWDTLILSVMLFLVRIANKTCGRFEHN